MQDSNIPIKFGTVWAVSATASYIRQVPATSADPVAASLTLGFPPATGTPVGSGGTPPDIRDENGILNQLTGWAQWFSAGAPIFYDATFAGNIGGYPKGAVVSKLATPGSFWVNTVENNSTNPDTGGANWTGYNLTGFGTAAYKNTSDNTKATVAAVGGATVATHLAVFSDTAGTIVDGGPAFTGGTSAQKAASNNSLPTVASVSGGTTINDFASFADGFGTIKDSGFSAASFDAAGAAAAAQAAAQAFATTAANTAQSNAQTFATNADTAVLSSAQSYANAQATAAQNNAQNFATAAVAVETARATSAEALKANIASPTFTGTPAAPTASPGTNTTQLASTAFVQAAVGPPVRYARVPVSISGSFALGSFTWNTAFPTSCLCAVASAENNTSFNPAANGNNFVVVVYSFNASGGNIRIDTNQGGKVFGSVMVDIIGFGS